MQSHLQQHSFHKKRLTRAILGSLIAIVTQSALADTTDLGTVQGSTAADNSLVNVQNNPASAAFQAPSQGSLNSTEPQSIINQHFIQENAYPGSNYPDLVQYSPSTWSVDPNGAGAMESQSGGPFVRGFQDGQYNVTFDGIPWGDSNDFTHHSTVYFMPQDMGGIVVDRGPGDASTLGDATFGGTMAMLSRAPGTTSDLTTYLDMGSFGTRLAGAQYDTGIMHQYGDASAFISYKSFHTDGYLTNANQDRTNLFVKLVKPIGDDTLLTFVGMQNHTTQNPPIGATLGELQQYGNNYGLVENPGSGNYQGYNRDDIHTDFEYVGVQTNLSGWRLDNKLYTYAYNHNGFNGLDQGSGQFPSLNGSTGTFYPVLADGTPDTNGVPGTMMTMDYRSIGDFLRLSRDMGPGTLNVGAWYDHQDNTRSQYETNATTGGYNYDNPFGLSLVPLSPTSLGSNNPLYYTDRYMTDTLDTKQAYIDYAWKPMSNLTVTPGIKYVSFTRGMNATVNQGNTGAPVNENVTWDKVLPSIDMRFMIQPDWSSYAQIATGFLAPNLNLFYPKGSATTTNPGSLNPESTTNYQVGTTYTTNQFVLSADVYYIHFNNLEQSNIYQGITVYSNAGGVDYDGFETEGTYHLGSGFNLYGNYTFNVAKTISQPNNPSQWIADTPEHTGVAGLIYNQGPAYASLMTKFVGQRYGDPGQQTPLSSYSITNFSSSYEIPAPLSWIKKATIGFMIDNLLNSQKIFASNGTDVNGNELYYTLPERSYMLNLSLSM
jgi:iron complex outermembrane receptor protein